MSSQEAVGFTGPVEASPGAHGIVASVIAEIKADVFVSGAAFGIDTLCAKLALELNPDKKHVLIVPQGKPHNQRLVAEFTYGGHEIVRVPGGYMARNDIIVLRSMQLFAFPTTKRETLRSGTWATIRRARAKGIPIHIHPLTS